MKLITHLTFAGQCEAAFYVYATCLGGEIALLLRYRDSGGPFAAEMADKVFHATLKVGDQVLTGVDISSGEYVRPGGFSVQLNLTDSVKAHSIFAVLSEGGAIHFAMQKTSWAEAYGSLTDRFGTPWEVNCGRFA